MRLAGAFQIRRAARAAERVFRMVGVSGVRVLRAGGASARAVWRAAPQLRPVGGGRAACASRQHVATRPLRSSTASNSRFPVHGCSTHHYSLPSSRYVAAFFKTLNANTECICSLK